MQIITDAMVEKEMEIIPELYGITEFGNVIGWNREKVFLYNTRNVLPSPATHIGNRPFWTKLQVYKYAQDSNIIIKEILLK